MPSVAPTRASTSCLTLTAVVSRETLRSPQSDHSGRNRFAVRCVAVLRKRAVTVRITRTQAQSGDGDAQIHAYVSQSPRTAKVLNRINDSVKWVVTAAAAIVLIQFRSSYVQWCLVGSIIAAFSCKVLKRLINRQRPANARKTDPGMPSSHATSLAYLATYLATAEQLKQPIIAVLGILFAFFMVSLRVILGYHSIAQVFAGTVLGASMAFIWHQLGQQFIFKLLAASQDGRLCLTIITFTAGAAFIVKALLQAKDAIVSSPGGAD